MTTDVTIVIPAFNEQATISRLLRDILFEAHKTKLMVDIIVIDDGSSDSTKKIVSELHEVTLISYKPNRGRAYAVQQGIKKAKSKFIAVFDADYEYYPSDLFSAINALEANHKSVVYGSRYRNHLNYKSSFRQKIKLMNDQSIGPWLANWVIAFLVGILYRRFYFEHFSGIRLYPSELLKNYKWKSTGFEGDHELAAASLILGYKVVEAPCIYKPRKKDEGKKIKAIDGLKAIWVFTKWRVIGKSMLRSSRINL